MLQYPDDGTTRVGLNRPSEPQYCCHNVLHVSSFVTSNNNIDLPHHPQRRIEKFIFFDGQWRHLGWINVEIDDDNETHRSTRINPWGIAFSKTSDEVYVTCSKNPISSSSAGGACVVKLSTCGCNTVLPLRDEDIPITPHSISCGKVIMLVGKDVFDQPNYVLAL